MQKTGTTMKNSGNSNDKSFAPPEFCEYCCDAEPVQIINLDPNTWLMICYFDHFVESYLNQMHEVKLISHISTI